MYLSSTAECDVGPLDTFNLSIQLDDTRTTRKSVGIENKSLVLKQYLPKVLVGNSS